MTDQKISDEAELDRLWAIVRSDVENERFEEAKAALLKLIELGDFGAYSTLGSIYDGNGDNEPSAYAQAVECYQKFLIHDDLPGVHLALARIYYFGLGQDKNGHLALKHLLSTKPEQQPQAAVLLANLYYYGEVVSKNSDRAKELYEIAVDAGYPWAMRQLSYINFREGRWLDAVKMQVRCIAQLAKLRYENVPDARLLGYRL